MLIHHVLQVVGDAERNRFGPRLGRHHMRGDLADFIGGAAADVVPWGTSISSAGQ